MAASSSSPDSWPFAVPAGQGLDSIAVPAILCTVSPAPATAQASGETVPFAPSRDMLPPQLLDREVGVTGPC